MNLEDKVNMFTGTREEILSCFSKQLEDADKYNRLLPYLERFIEAYNGNNDLVYQLSADALNSAYKVIVL